MKIVINLGKKKREKITTTAKHIASLLNTKLTEEDEKVLEKLLLDACNALNDCYSKMCVQAVLNLYTNKILQKLNVRRISDVSISKIKIFIMALNFNLLNLSE